VLCALALVSATSASAQDQALWEKFAQGELVALMRHALAPGTGDPVNFRIDDCSTQRNLSDVGREQSSRIGELLRSHNIASADIYTSQWCRCVDTAGGLELGEPRPLPLLNSFFQDRSTATEQTRDLENWIKNRLEKAATGPTLPSVMVSHQVNISALASVYPRSGEIVFIGLEEEELVVVATQLTE